MRVLQERHGELHKLLATTPLFAGLDPKILARIARGAERLDVAPGTSLFRRGDACDGLYTVVSGRVKLSITTDENGEKVIELVGPGGSFGESAAFVDEPHIVSAEALAAAALIHVRKETLLACMRKDVQFSSRLVQALSRRLRELINKIERSTMHSGTERVLDFLIGELPATAANGTSTIALPAKKRIIASQLDLTHEHFSRILHDLAAARLLVVQGSKVTIPDVSRLRAYRRKPHASGTRKHAA